MNNIRVQWYCKANSNDIRVFNSFKHALDCYREFLMAYLNNNKLYKPVIYSQETIINGYFPPPMTGYEE